METRSLSRFYLASSSRSNLRAARLQQRGHAVLRYFPFLHRLGELPGDHLFDRLCLRLFEDPLLFQEVINAGTPVLLAHCINSFWRLRANAKSSSGVARAFLMKRAAPSNVRGTGRASRAPRVLSADPSSSSPIVLFIVHVS